MGGSVLLPNLHSLRASEEVEDCDHLLVPSAAAALPSIPSTDVRRAGCLSGVGSGGESGAVLALFSIDVGEGEEDALEVFEGDEKLDAKLDPTDWASHGRHDLWRISCARLTRSCSTILRVGSRSFMEGPGLCRPSSRSSGERELGRL